MTDCIFQENKTWLKSIAVQVLQLHAECCRGSKLTNKKRAVESRWWTAVSAGFLKVQMSPHAAVVFLLPLYLRSNLLTDKDLYTITFELFNVQETLYPCMMNQFGATGVGRGSFSLRVGRGKGVIFENPLLLTKRNSKDLFSFKGRLD